MEKKDTRIKIFDPIAGAAKNFIDTQITPRIFEGNRIKVLDPVKNYFTQSTAVSPVQSVPNKPPQFFQDVAGIFNRQPQQVQATPRATATPTPTRIPSPTPTQSAQPQGVAMQLLQKMRGASPTPTASPTPRGPTPTPMPIQIQIPSADGPGMTKVPQAIADALFRAFDQYGEATNAARVMHHPMSVSGTPGEVQQGFNHWGNRGENPSFNPRGENKNRNGSLDRGLLQINSDTFNGMKSNPFWAKAMEKRGITSYEDMFDPQKNALMGMLILMRGNFDAQTGGMRPNPNYSQWYGAPQDLRTR